MDYVVFAYVAAICVLTGRALRPRAGAARLEDQSPRRAEGGGRGSTGNRRVRWFSSAMVVTELALTVVLLAGAGLMIRSFLTLYALDIGIKTER